MIRANATWRLVAVAGAAGLVLAACGSDDGGETDDGDREPGRDGHPPVPRRRQPRQRPAGRARTRAPSRVSRARSRVHRSTTTFKERLNEVDPELKKIGYSYAPESYDAVIVVALAAQQANSDAGKRHGRGDAGSVGQRHQVHDVRRVQRADRRRRGHRLRRQVSGPIEFDSFGDPTSASIGIYQYDAKNTVPGYNADGEALDYIADEHRPDRGHAPGVHRQEERRC